MLDIRRYLNPKGWFKSACTIKFWLIVLLFGLAALNLVIIDQAHHDNLFSLALLMWLTLLHSLWERRHGLTLRSDGRSSMIGGMLLGFILLRNIAGSSDFSVRLLPVIGVISLVLIASGAKSLKTYWREITLSGLLLYAKLAAVFLQIINLTLLTAKVANAFLYIIGFETYREGFFITLPQGRIQVLGVCSGETSIILLLSVAFLFFFLLPISHGQKGVSLTFAALLGFVINVVRITLLAILVNSGDRQSFNYWHGENGSLLFAMISVGLFGAFCWFAYVRPQGELSSLAGVNHHEN
ncbi:MAG: hypothetical protein RLZZ568_1684 [Cyanobacteriota bacterium]